MNAIRNISLVGAGNVATHLGTELYKNGLKITSVYSRTFEHAQQLASKMEAVPITDVSNIIPSDLLIIALPDNVIPEITNELTNRKGIIVHTSGSTNIEILNKTSAEYGVFYPLQTFSKKSKLDVSKIPFCIEGSNENTEKILIELAKKISKNVYQINSEQRKMLHVSAVFACNFTNFMFTVANNILEKEGISFEIMKPLIAETANKIKVLKPIDAQTGPAIRRDTQTLKKHQEYLSNFPEYKKIYTFISEKIQKQWCFENTDE